MKRLAFFSRHLEIGGLERALVTLLNGLDPEKVRVTLVLEQKRGPLLSELPAWVEVREYRLSRCPFVPLRRLLNFAHRQLWRLRHGGRYDFACAYCTYSVLGSRLAQAASKNSALYIHNDYGTIYPREDEFRAFFESLRVRDFRRLLFVSNEGRDSLVRRYPELERRAHVINNLVDQERLRRLAAEPCPCARRPGETVFIFLGRLDETQKRLSRLLEAFARAAARRGAIRLWDVGDGPDRSLCEELIRQHDLADLVVMAGAQTNPYPWLNAADCLVLASDYEGFPVVYYEALALGKDIITTVPASDELMDAAAYAVLTEKTAESLAGAMDAYAPSGREPLELEGFNKERLRRLCALWE